MGNFYCYVTGGGEGQTQYIFENPQNRLNLGHSRPLLRGEWPSGLYSPRQVTEIKLGRMRSNSGWVTPEASQLTSSSFGRDAKLGVPCPDAACIVGLN